jgi:tRNA-dihydrouridine synthase B
MAQAAQFNVDNGAQIIDINMGCPAKKVNKKLAGSALLQQPDLVEAIVKAVVEAVNVPVTLKIRTGWDTDNINGVQIAKIAEANGIQSLAVHGRTRACMYKGNAEYDTIRKIKEVVSIPVIANGDITSVDDAKEVLRYTGADGIMIGRGAQGNPWIFRQINYFMTTGKYLTEPSIAEKLAVLTQHIQNVQQFYGDTMGVRIARKHVGWYVEKYDSDRTFRRAFNAIDEGESQIEALAAYFSALSEQDNTSISPAA